MKINNKFIKIMLVFIIVFFMTFSVININADSKIISAIFYGDQTQLVNGQDYKVTLKLADFKNIEKGLYAYKAKIVYDKNIFENLNQNSFKSLNNWEKLQYNEKTGEFVAIKKSGCKAAEEVVQITLKVKNRIESSQTKVEIKDVVVSEGKKDIFVDNETVSVKILNNISDDNSSNNSDSLFPNQPSNTITSVKDNYNGFVNVYNENQESNEIDKSEIEIEKENSIDKDYSEFSDYEEESEDLSESKKSKSNRNYIIICIILLIDILVVIYFIIKNLKNRDDDDDKKKNTTKAFLIVFLSILSLQVFNTVEAAFYDFSNKGEVNGDNKVDYNDVSLLESHLINKLMLANKYLENADLNNDGVITITDLALLIQKLENKLDYEVKFDKVSQDSEFVNKNIDFYLKFKADVSYGAKIEKVKINNEYYDVILDNSDDIYKVKVNASNIAGIKEYVFSEVVLNNQKSLAVNFVEKVEVLKSVPLFKNYIVNDDFIKSEATISFDLLDTDKAFTSGKVQILNENGTLVKEFDIKEGKNQFNITIENNKIYNALFNINYNLTSNEDLTNYNGKLEFIKEIQIIGDYKFDIGNYKIYNGQIETNNFYKNEDVKISFDSSNVTKYVPEFVKINGKSYKLFIENNKYIIVIPGFDNIGNKNIKIENITLNNGKQFEVNKELFINVIKKAPKISDFMFEENEKGEFEVNFDIENDDDALISMIINVTDDKDILLEQIKLTNDELKGSKSISKLLKDLAGKSKYRISIVANYLQTDNDSDIQKNVILYQNEFLAQFRASILEVNSDKKYYEKGEKALLTYKIETNCSHDINKLRINNKDYLVTKVGEGLYQVVYTVPTNSGIYDISTSKVVCSSGNVASVSNNVKLEVLKDAITLEDYKEEFNTSKSKVNISFNLNDIDNSFVSGKLIFTKKNGEVEYTKDINIGKNTVSLDLEAFTTYDLKINVTYDRDSNTDNFNRINKDLIFKEIEGSKEYNLVLSNLKTIKNNKETKYFAKNEKINLVFESINARNLDIVEVTVNGKKYAVTKNSNNYQVIVDGFSAAGNKTLTIEKLKLSNSVELIVKENNNIKIEILKDVPTVTDFNHKIDSNNSKVKIEFNLNDNDKSLISSQVLLVDNKGDIVSRKDIVKGKNSLDFNIKRSVLYTLKINASYDRDSSVDSTNNYQNKTLFTKEIIDNTDYSVTITDFKALKDNLESKYFVKNEKINLIFTSENASKLDTKEVTINGKQYVVVKNNNNYQVVVDGFSDAGSKTLTIEKVKLSNNIEMDVLNNNKIEIEILKNKPSINNYKVVENINESSLDILFDLVDSDNSAVNSTLKISDESGKVIKTVTIKKGANTVKLNVEESKDYKANFVVDYNLSSDSNSTDKNIIGKVKLDKTLRLDINYNFLVSNFKTYNDKNEETLIFAKDQDIKIIFESSNATTNIPEKIQINNKEYDVKLENGKYTATVSGFNSFGSKKLNIQKIILSNKKQFEIKQNIDITIVKNTPSISNLDIEDNTQKNYVEVSFDIKDEDSALISMSIDLFNDKDEIIEQISLSNDELSMENISKRFKSIYTSKYKVKVVSTYLLTDKESDTKENVILGTKEIESVAQAEIVSVVSDKKYYEKGDDVVLTYVFNTNKTDDISNVMINNKDYDAIKQSDGSYQVTYKLSSIIGVKSLTASRVTFSNHLTAGVNKTLKIEVLKQEPKVSNFKQIDSINDSKVTLNFDVNDTDNSFISGKADLISRKDGSVVSKTIKVGANSLEFDVTELEMYDLNIKATFDRDTNTLSTDENLITDKILLTHEVQLVVDYDLTVSNMVTYKNNNASKYFLKNEDITLLFKSTNVTSFDVSEVVVNGKKYTVTKNNDNYQVNIKGYDTSGVKKLTIEKVKLSNTKEFTITEDNEIQIEVLKTEPSIKEFSYEEDVYGDVTIKFNLVDEENTISKGKVQIIDDAGAIIEENLNHDRNTVKFTPKENASYIVKILADYDLDTNKLDNSSNNYKDVILLENEISLGSRQFQVKDIASTIVYTQTDEGIREAENIKITDLENLNNFIVKVKPRDMSAFYTTIESYRVDNNKLKLTLKYDDVVQYNGTKKQNNLEIEYGTVKNGSVEGGSLELLIKKIEANPSGTFELTKDYDASFVSGAALTAISEKFSGTLNGNGHKITNLRKPFFNELEGAKIKNIIFENVILSGSNSHGTIANIATDTTVTNVHIKGLNYTTGANHSAGFIGEATDTNVEKSSVTNFVITTAGHVRVSAIIGKLTNGSIKNCYAQGAINSTQTKDANGIGGVLGHGYGEETIENCITKIAITNNQGPRLNGALVGLFMNKASVLKNNVSLSTGANFYTVYGNGSTVTATNNYELQDSGLNSNESVGKFSIIAKENINRNFYKNDANFDETIWDLTDTSYDKLPLLKNDDPNTVLSDTEVQSLYIPDYKRIKNVAGYKKNKEILYHNIYKLMPFYDAKFLVEDATKIDSNSLLATKVIKHILPYNNGKLVTYFTNENHNSITDIKVVFDGFEVVNYKVNFNELKNNISIYEIEELGLHYSPNSYIIKNDASIVSIIEEYIKGLDYTTVLDPLTTAADARHYKDNYNEVIKGLALNITLQLLQNDEENILTINNEILNNKIKENLIDSGRLNKIIYAYNYFNRWYSFEIGGAKISDILLFENKMFKDTNSFDAIINEVFVGNMGVAETHTFFNTNIKKYTNSTNIATFLDSIIAGIGGYDNVDDWFTEYFGARNILAEFGVDKNPNILYRGWYQLKKNGRMILPVITLPENCTYMISGPAHLQIGPSQLYHKDVNTAAGRAAVQKKVNDHSNLVKRHLSTLAGSFDPGKWNNYCIMVYDCTRIITGYKNTYFPGTNIVIGTSPVYTQGKVGQNYPFFKNFSEVLGLWQPGGSAAGVGNTAGFLWFIARPGLTNFDTWTHEFEHALFDKIMLFQAGTRFKAGLETLTEGNVQQNGVWSENNLTQDVGPYYFNTSFDLNKEGNATQNLSPDRIDTREKLENYFRGQQNALDLLDYIEGKAFIRLTPEQQARVATRMNQSGSWSTWGAITAAQAEQMNLTSLESLYDNRIIIRPENAWGVSVRGLKVINSLGSNDYGFESVWVNRWYIGHNDNGIPDAFSAKRNYFEMLGYAGVDGYVTYGRGNTKTDLDAIQKVTKAVTGTAMNWKEYKMSRYATVEENIRNNKYIDVDNMIERFYQALLSDTNRNATSRTNLRKIYYHYLKSVTNDFVDDPLGTTVEVNHIKTAEELVEKINAQPYGYYVLDNDIDFSHMTTNVTQTFMGRLDGNGHKIIGNTLPIFNKIRYGYVGNIHFENTNIPKTISNAGALSYKSEMSTVEKINVTNLKMNFGGRNDLSLIGGAVSNVVTRDCTVEKFAYHIRSAEDMAKLNEDTGGIFVIDNDIDFAGKNYNGTVISNIFTGKIDGQGHTLSNLTDASLFANFRGTVENLKIKNFSNTSSGRGNGDYVTAFTQESFTATFRNLRFENITLSGRNNVAVVSGADARDNANSVFENISVKNANVTGTGVYVSTFIGRKYGGRISNVFVQGKLTINSTENGGLVGSLQQNGTVVENVVTDVSITKTHNTYGNASLAEINGSMFGNIYNTPVIRNSIAFGSMTGYTNTAGVELKPYKFVGASEAQIIETMTKCFEVDEEIGSTRVSENTNGKLNSVARANLNKQFYKDLGFDESMWNLDSLSTKGYPVLK